MHVIITDSIAKYVAIQGCKTVSYREAKNGDIKKEIRESKEMLKGYDNIIIYVGTNNLERQNSHLIMSEYMGLINVLVNSKKEANSITSGIIPRPRAWGIWKTNSRNQQRT